MPWALNISPLIDLGGYYGNGLVALRGSVFSPPNPGGGGAPLGTVTSTAPPSFLTLPFGSGSVPPAASGTVLVTDSVTEGDLVHANVAAFPASPASAALVTFPSASETDEQLKDAVAEWVAREGGSLRPTMVPYEAFRRILGEPARPAAQPPDHRVARVHAQRTHRGAGRSADAQGRLPTDSDSRLQFPQRHGDEQRLTPTGSDRRPLRAGHGADTADARSGHRPHAQGRHPAHVHRHRDEFGHRPTSSWRDRPRSTTSTRPGQADGAQQRRTRRARRF